MSDGRVRRQLAVGAVGLFLLTAASLSLATLARAQDDTAALTLQMEADPTTFSAVGEEIEYTYLLTNTGGVTLDAVSLTDTVVEDVLCQSGPLEPDGSLACTGAYTITQDDLDVGEVSNIALGEGTYGDEVVDSNEVSLTITALATAPAALTLQMEADPTTFSAVGEEIEYTYLLTNTGGVTLDAVSLTDTVVEDVLCQSGPLEPDGSLACTGAYTITQDDLDVGEVSNIALGEGTYGDEVVDSNEVSLTITALATAPAALTLQMEADPTTFSAVGEEIEYTYLLTNTGGVTLDAVSLTDTVVEDVLCQSGPLEPDGSLACTGAYTITQDDLDVGEVSNIALGEGTYGDEVVDSNEVSLTITALATAPAALTLQMEADPTTFSAVGEEIEYTYLLTNTGGVTLDAVSLTDTVVEDVLCQSGPLEPDGSLACTGAYTITQDDLDVGEVSNIALGEGTYGDEVVDSNEVSLTITLGD